MQEAHELHPFHIRGLVPSGSTEAGEGPNTSQEAPSEVPQSKPTEASFPFVCHVCLANYGATESHLHSSAPWYCHGCDVVVHEEHKSEHLASDSHRLQESTASNTTPPPASASSSEETFFCLPCRAVFPTAERNYHIASSYYCSSCKLVMHSDMRDIHEWSPAHNSAVATTAPGPVKPMEWFNCQTCDDRFPISVKPFHRSRAWKCGLCNTVVHMDWIGAHLAGTEHEEKERSQSE